MNDEANEQWHLDKRVPVAIILALLGQTVGFVWFQSKLDSRVGQLEARAVIAESYGERLTRLEERLQSTNAILERIDKKIDKALDQFKPRQ